MIMPPLDVRSLRFRECTDRRRIQNVPLSKRYPGNMETAHYRYTPGDENYHLSFLYDDPSLNVQRQFNFIRQNCETIGALVSRIHTNLDKVLSKKKKKMKNNEAGIVEGKTIDVKFVQDGQPVSQDLICIDVLKEELETKLQINEKIFTVTVNAPWIVNMALPGSILVGFPMYPIKFEALFYKKEHCVFRWFTGNEGAILNQQWTETGMGYTYFPTSSDIGKKIKLTCVPGNEKMTGPQVEVVSSVFVEAGPGFCPFENRHMFTTTKLSGNSFRVVSYNILADLYCDSEFTRTELFPYCPAYALHIDYRKQLFIKEILGYNSDIVCLQEVDAKVFNADLQPVMEANSYGGTFTRKGGQVAEGLACFYRSDRFKLIEEKFCILGEELQSPIFKDIWSLIENNEPFVTRLKPRTTAVQATVLESVDNANEILVVGNTHFYFKPDADHIRIMQGGLTILWLCDMINKMKLKFPQKRVSLILCGDFNSVPSCGVYKLYTTGHVPKDFVDWRSNESQAVTNVELKQPILMESACGTPEFTNFTVGFADCLDYIFYQKNAFEVCQVIPFPSVEELSEHSALPSVVFPSDHIASVADLKFK